jgi:hypothetical protein
MPVVQHAINKREGEIMRGDYLSICALAHMDGLVRQYGRLIFLSEKA